MKIIFYPKWERWAEGNLRLHSTGVYLDDIIFPLGRLVEAAEPTCTIYGLEQLDFIPGGALCDAYKQYFPGTRLTRSVLHDAARHELQHGTLYDMMKRLKDSDVPTYESAWEECIVFKTLNDYLLDATSHHHELNPED